MPACLSNYVYVCLSVGLSVSLIITQLSCKNTGRKKETTDLGMDQEAERNNKPWFGPSGQKKKKKNFLCIYLYPYPFFYCFFRLRVEVSLGGGGGGGAFRLLALAKRSLLVQSEAGQRTAY